MKPIIGISCSIEERSYVIGGDYVRALIAAGGVAVGIPPVEDEAQAVAALQRLDGLLLSGGADIDPCHYGEEIIPENGSLEPERDRSELLLARLALRQGLPVLGICRGMQVLNVAAGGSLYQDLPTQTDSRLQHRQRGPRWYATHSIQITPGSLLAAITGVTTTRVNSFHHQAVHHPGEGFTVTAMAPDGVVEAIEASAHPFALGVQWHPECMQERDAVQASIFKAFLRAATDSREAQESRTPPVAGDTAG